MMERTRFPRILVFVTIFQTFKVKSESFVGWAICPIKKEKLSLATGATCLLGFCHQAPSPFLIHWSFQPYSPTNSGDKANWRTKITCLIFPGPSFG